MTDDDDFADRSRLRCAPTECQHNKRGCWVMVGRSDTIDGKNRCRVCQGRIRIENWLSPHEDRQAAREAALARSRQDRLAR
jgi:hypothetical protein